MTAIKIILGAVAGAALAVAAVGLIARRMRQDTTISQRNIQSWFRRRR
jgi:nitrate reductase gamma subunit